MKVLIADDDRMHVQLVSSRLKAQGIHVSVAFDAMQAWMIATQSLPNAIILDIQMPGGRELRFSESSRLRRKQI